MESSRTRMGKLLLIAALCAMPAQVFGLTVTTNDIANGAVTDIKITGPISRAKIEKYAGVVVVAKTGGDFTSPIAAVNSIANPSAANRYLVKVMPGEYDLGTASLDMRSYVDVEGSGQDNTVIKSSIKNTVTTECTVGTVNMANDSALTKIKVVNMPAADAEWIESGAIAFNDVKARVEGVSVLIGDDTTAHGGRNNGVCVYGENSNALLNNVNVESHNNGGQSNPIMMHVGGNLVLKNSNLVAFNTSAGNYHGINSNGGPTDGSIKVYNTTVSMTCPVSGDAIFTDGFKTEIMDSVFTITNPSQSTYIYSGPQGVTLVNTRFVSTTPGVYYVDNITAVNSQLPGGAGLPGILTNCYDENFRPITNQP